MTCKLMSFSLDFVWSWDGNRQLVDASFLLQAQETCLFISAHQIRDDIPNYSPVSQYLGKLIEKLFGAKTVARLSVFQNTPHLKMFRESGRLIGRNN